MLQQNGAIDVIYPENNFGSESLWEKLKDNSLLNKENIKVTIIKGLDGRTYLTEKLESILKSKNETKTNLLNEICVYKRELPKDNALVTKFKNIFQQVKTDVILITCKTSLENLIYLAKDAKIDIYKYQLLVISERLYLYAKNLNFANVIKTDHLDAANMKRILFYETSKQQH